MNLSFRRVGGRMVLAAGVCAAAILIFRGEEAGPRTVTYVIDPRPLGDAVRHIDVTVTVGDDVQAWQTRDQDRHEPLQPLHLTTPTPASEVTITLDVVTADGAHRVVHRVTPAAGAVVEIALGAEPPAAP